MCIALFSTAHPKYALIVLNNRDEFLTRPTAQATWWQAPHTNVLGGRDLQRSVRGTWLGITKEGLLAVLTNFREEGAVPPEARSRGAMVNAFLTQTEGQFDSTADFIKHLVNEDGEGLKGVGGFSLVCGRVGEPLAVISNRTPSVEETSWVLGERGETVGLSNALFTDGSWTKVTDGKKLLQSVIERNLHQQKQQEEGLIEELFDLLSHDTLPKRPADRAGWESYIKEFRNSIFIPAVGGEAMADGARAEDLTTAESKRSLRDGLPVGNEGSNDPYGTQKQSVVLVNNKGHVMFIERTLFDNNAKPMGKEASKRRFEFDIEGWKG